MRKILLLEDDEGLNGGISFALKKEGYLVFQAYSIGEAEKIFKKEDISLVICDITLPDGSGLEFGKKVRERSGTCLIYLTALDRETDIINGYEMGADDYVTKPFSLMVLISKVHAVMRRSGGGKTDLFRADDLEVHIATGTVLKNGENIILSRTEFQILLCLLENAGRILSKEQILERVWGNEGQFVDENTVTVNISRLKSKLQEKRISNVRGLGYLWDGQVLKG